MDIRRTGLTRRASLALAASAAALPVLGLPGTAHAAPCRGGKLIFGRNADSLLLDPVLTELNVDHLGAQQPLRHAAAADR